MTKQCMYGLRQTVPTSTGCILHAAVMARGLDPSMHGSQCMEAQLGGGDVNFVGQMFCAIHLVLRNCLKLSGLKMLGM